MFIIEFKNGNRTWWIAPWSGDPGRTLLKNNARKFKTEKKGDDFLKRPISKNKHRNLSGSGRVVAL